MTCIKHVQKYMNLHWYLRILLISHVWELVIKAGAETESSIYHAFPIRTISHSNQRLDEGNFGLFVLMNYS